MPGEAQRRFECPGLMGEWLSQRSAKPSTAVRIRFRPRKCRADDFYKSSVFVCRSVWVQAPTPHQTTPACRLLLCNGLLRIAHLLIYGCEDRVEFIARLSACATGILARTSLPARPSNRLTSKMQSRRLVKVVCFCLSARLGASPHAPPNDTSLSAVALQWFSVHCSLSDQ